MSEPEQQPTDEQPTVRPTVATDPARSRWSWSRVPAHLGRARTSTVVLGALFLAIGALYLNIRPETVDPATAGTSGVVQQSPTPAAPPTTTAPETSTAPETTADEPSEPTTSAPTTSASTPPTATSTPTGTTEPTPTLPTLTPRSAPNTSPSSPTP